MKEFMFLLPFVATAALAEPVPSPLPKPPIRKFDLVKLDFKKPELDKIIEAMPKEKQKELQNLMLDIEQKELNLKRLFLVEPVDWEKVKEENKQLANVTATLRTELQKFLYDKKPVPVPPPMKKEEPRPEDKKI